MTQYIGMLNFLDILQILSGALVGLLVGLTGVGGGSLMTPVLILLLGVPPIYGLQQLQKLWPAGGFTKKV